VELVDRLRDLLQGPKNVCPSVRRPGDDLQLVANPILEHETDSLEEFRAIRLLLAQHGPQQRALGQQQPGDCHLTCRVADLKEHGCQLAYHECEQYRYKEAVAPPPTTAEETRSAKNAHQYRLHDHQEMRHVVGVRELHCRMSQFVWNRARSAVIRRGESAPPSAPKIVSKS